VARCGWNEEGEEDLSEMTDDVCIGVDFVIKEALTWVQE
jgi:hypothetical protein